MSGAQDHERVRRRRVFYLPGYDPFPPRRYRELYRTEGAKQAAISGYDLTLRPRSGDGFGWHVDAHIAGQDVTAEVEVLVWSDIVQSSMNRSILATYWQLARTAWIYIATGALFRLMRLRKGPVIAALYPVVALLVQLALALLAGWGLARGIAQIWPAVAWGGVVAGLGLVWAILKLFQRRDNRLFAYYLMHDYAFSARWRGANPPALEDRMASFTARISAALDEDWDEVLVVGHSSGAHLAVSCLAELIRVQGVPADRHLAFLSLGQVIPMVSFLPDANRLRADLQVMSEQPDIPWIDVTAPGDGCAFALCDPVAVSGLATTTQHWPLVMSAAFTQTLSPETWKTLRWRFFRLHFQYLCAFDRPGDYDYFALTAGPQRLGDRYAARAPSPSTIRRPVNRFTAT